MNETELIMSYAESYVPACPNTLARALADKSELERMLSQLRYSPSRDERRRAARRAQRAARRRTQQS